MLISPSVSQVQLLNHNFMQTFNDYLFVKDILQLPVRQLPLTLIFFHSEIMLTFVSVFVLAVIGTQAAPQFQPADAAQQPNVPSVTILSQTDSIGADGSFNNRCGFLCSKNISVF